MSEVIIKRMYVYNFSIIYECLTRQHIMVFVHVLATCGFCDVDAICAFIDKCINLGVPFGEANASGV